MNKKTRTKLLNTVKQNYEDIADEFSGSRNYLWPELKKIINTKNGDEIFDLGCGNGRLYELFKDADANYTGIDQSNNLIKIAQQKYSKAKFIQGDILKIFESEVAEPRLQNKKFDLILLIAVLLHIPSYKLRLEFLKDIKNCLKPSGRLIITVWDLHASPKHKKLILKHNIKKLLGLNKMDFNDILFPGFNKKSLRYYHAFTENELKKLLIQAGFKIHKLYKDNKNIYAVCQK